MEANLHEFFNGRNTSNILDYKLGNSSNSKYQPQTEVAEKVQKLMKVLLDQTKKNKMQSSLK